MPVGALLAVFGFLPGTARAVRTGDILLFLGFGFHFAGIFRRRFCLPKNNATTGNNLVYVSHDSTVRGVSYDESDISDTRLLSPRQLTFAELCQRCHRLAFGHGGGSRSPTCRNDPKSYQ